MGKDNRVQYRRRHCYATNSNKVKKVKTPGGKIVAHYHKKRVSGPKCGDCHGEIHGIPAFRPKVLKRLNKRHKTVTRAYGGSRCAGCVRDRIIRAFLVEERKVVKAVLASAKQAAKK